jgi:alkanesulfonate monooxygenase SsuD/methylene tetrahydromethanopterin reductase-like flavin-dependent oxidoreductase (luciferase family)
MEFGIFHSGYVPRRSGADEQRSAEHARLHDEVAIAVAGEAAGFKYSWVTEHHFLDEYSHISASEVLLGYLAARTEKLHLGSGIWNLTPPVNPPVRVAERVAMMDHLSNGRFEFGTGRGSSSTEFKGFGIADGDTTKSMHDESLREVIRMMTETEYSYDGEHFSVPPRIVLPKPYTVPHPPLWLAAGNPSSFEKAGRLGMGVLCFTYGAPEEIAPLIEVYKKAVANADPIGGYVNNNVACVRALLCLDDREEAFRLNTTTGSARYQSLVLRWLDTFPFPAGVPRWPELIPEATTEQLRERIDADALVLGDPDDCARSVQRYADVGCDQLIFGVLNSTISREDAIRSLQTFGTHVIPTFDTDTVHSTTRQREAALARSTSSRSGR